MSICLSGLLDVLRECPPYQALLREATDASARTRFNVVRSARPFVLAALAADWDGPLIYLTAEVRRAYNVSEQLPVWIDMPERLYRFAEPSALFYDRAPWDSAVIRNRIETLTALQRDQSADHPIIVASARALMQVTMPPDKFGLETQTLAVGERHNLDALIRSWTGMGYELATIVIEQGAFSRRGGILDVFPLAEEYPVRIEFFDDEIESLRLFDPNDQRSIRHLRSMSIVPAREALPRMMPAVGETLAEWTQSISNDAAEFSSIHKDIDSTKEGMTFPYLEHYLPFTYEQPACLLDYLPENSLILIEDEPALEAAVDELTTRAEANRADALNSHQIAANHPEPFLRWDALQQQISSRQSFDLSNFQVDAEDRLFQPGQRFGGQLRTMLNQARQYRNRGDRVVIVTEQVERLENLWYEQDASEFIPTSQSISRLPMRVHCVLFVAQWPKAGLCKVKMARFTA